MKRHKMNTVNGLHEYYKESIKRLYRNKGVCPMLFDPYQRLITVLLVTV